DWFVDKYQKWSTYTPEKDGVLIAYTSVYGHTESVAESIAARLAEKGVRDIRMFDVSVTHPSYIVAEAFRVSHIVFASTTYNAGIFVNMETLLHDIVAHNLQKRTIALVENGSWAPTAAGLMRELLSRLKNTTILEQSVTVKSSLKAHQIAEVEELAEAIVQSRPAAPGAAPPPTEIIEPNAMFKLSYGLFVLTARDGDRDNGCIINTAAQVTSNPNRISITVNKGNYTHDMILKTGVFNVSVLTTEAPFDIFKYYGFQSGREVNKFPGSGFPRSRNNLIFITGCTNAFLSGKVIEARDCGTHTLFIADVTEAQVLSGAPSLTYAYYFDNIKPKPQKPAEKKTGWVCKICGYVYEGEELPEDFECPLCKHGASDFEKLQ
ncbi:MAG: flavin reductase, partial [Clostridia bacterium]|nr:flavin reductase [Clostridia bacterium]